MRLVDSMVVTGRSRERRGGARPELLLFLGYLFLQELIVLGLMTPRYPDSETYMHFNLTGHDRRLPTVPLLYKIFPTDSSRVAAQVVLAAVAWWVLALFASRLIADRRARIGLRVVLLLLGLLGPIASWNSIILSESAAISLTALMIGLWLNFGSRPGWRALAAALAATLAWTLARQPDVLFGLGITLAGLGAAVFGRQRLALRVSLAVGLVAISAIGLLEIRNNQTLSKNSVGAIVQIRVLPNRDWTRWFVAHGMPYSPKVASLAGQPFHYLPQTDPAFYEWLYSHGQSAYLRFVLSHPRYTLVGPLPYFSGEEASLHHPDESAFGPLQPNPTPSMISPTVAYGRHRDVVPQIVQTALFNEGQFGDVLALAFVGILLTVLAMRRGGWDARLFVPIVTAALAVPEGYVLWLSGGEATGELDRLSMVTAVSVRIGLWVLLAVSADRLLVARRDSRATVTDGSRSLPLQHV